MNFHENVLNFVKDIRAQIYGMDKVYSPCFNENLINGLDFDGDIMTRYNTHTPDYEIVMYKIFFNLSNSQYVMINEANTFINKLTKELERSV